MPDLTTPIPAPQIPATGGEGKASEVLHLDDAEFAKSLGLDTIVPENTQPPRDTDGKFIAKDTVLVDTTLAKVPAVPAEQPVEEKPAETTAEETAVEEQPTERVKPPLTKFAVLDAEGKPVELPTDLKVDYKDNGKQVQESLEKVVHRAQQNAHNARQVQTLSESLTQRDQQVADYEQTFQSYEQQIARMFQNPEVYEQARMVWLDANSPEKQLERANETIRESRQREVAAEETGRVADFVSGTIMPSISQLAEQYGHVTQDDLLGRFALYVPAYQVNGKVPLANLPKLQQFVDTELAQWAASTHEQRAKAYGSAKADADKSLQKERETSQALKRQVAKVLAPAGTSPQNSQAKPTPIKKASDVFNDPMFGGSSN